MVWEGFNGWTLLGADATCRHIPVPQAGLGSDIAWPRSAKNEPFFFGFVKSREKKYTTSPKHNTELLGYGQLGPSFCSSGSVLLLLLYCSSTPPLLQLTAQFPPCRRPSPQQICLLQICLRRLDAYPTYRLADRLGRSSALLSFGYDSQYFGISHIVVFVLC